MHEFFKVVDKNSDGVITWPEQWEYFRQQTIKKGYSEKYVDVAKPYIKNSFRKWAGDDLRITWSEVSETMKALQEND